MKILTYGCIVTATLLLTITCAIYGLWSLALSGLGFGGLWLVGVRQTWISSAPVGLTTLTISTALAVWYGLPAFWMLVVISMALAGWNLHQFWERLTGTTSLEYEGVLFQVHLRRLVGVIGVGLLLGGVALLIEFRLALGWIFLLGLVVVFSLSWTIGYFKRLAS